VSSPPKILSQEEKIQKIIPLESPLYVILDALWRPSVNSTFTAQEMLFQIKWAIAQYEQEGVDVSRNIRTV
jgi:hypothetical protein